MQERRNIASKQSVLPSQTDYNKLMILNLNLIFIPLFSPFYRIIITILLKFDSFDSSIILGHSTLGHQALSRTFLPS
jgi:hypothetical protein